MVIRLGLTSVFRQQHTGISESKHVTSEKNSPANEKINKVQNNCSPVRNWSQYCTTRKTIMNDPVNYLCNLPGQLLSGSPWNFTLILSEIGVNPLVLGLIGFYTRATLALNGLIKLYSSLKLSENFFWWFKWEQRLIDLLK